MAEDPCAELKDAMIEAMEEDTRASNPHLTKFANHRTIASRTDPEAYQATLGQVSYEIGIHQLVRVRSAP